MEKLTIKIDYSDFVNNDLTNYLSTISGISKSSINIEKNEIYVEYDASIISLKIIKMEIMLYLDISKIPSIVAFNKHKQNDIKEYTILIEDLCCEYCLKGMIEDLLELDGIVSAYSDFDYVNKYNVSIFITYDEKKLNENELKLISKKLKNYEKI